MKALFTKNTSIASKLIRQVTNEPVSHVALEFNNGIIVHSNFKGLHITWASKFRKENDILFELHKKSTIGERFKLDRMLNRYETSFYDIGAFLYIGVKLLLSKVGIKLPKKNLWQSTGMFLCTEWATKYIDDKEDSMITPYKLYKKLKQTSDWK